MLIAGGLTVALGVFVVVWPTALTQVQRTLVGLLPSSDTTLPSVINVHAPSAAGGPRPTQSVLVGASPGPTPVPSAPAPAYGGPTVVSPPVYAYPSPAPSAEGGGDRHGGKPSPSPGGHD